MTGKYPGFCRQGIDAGPNRIRQLLKAASGQIGPPDAAGEKKIEGVTSQNLCEEIKAHGHKEVIHTDGFKAALSHLKQKPYSKWSFQLDKKPCLQFIQFWKKNKTPNQLKVSFYYVICLIYPIHYIAETVFFKFNQAN